MSLFAIATTLPMLLIALAAFQGGPWGWLAVGYVTVLVFAFDRLIALQRPNPDPEAEFPAADWLLVALGLVHFWVLALALWGVAGDSGRNLTERALLAIAVGLVSGQIAHPVAHELIHRAGRGKRRLGRLIYTSLLFGHHASAHLHVHHPHVASAEDPCSARPGQGFYCYMARAWPSAFRAGLRAETRRHGTRAAWRHPYALYLGGAAALLLVSGALFGWRGLAALCFIAGYAQIQILLSDYVQHYGLRRTVGPNGRKEPVGPQHSWNAPHWYSSAMTLNAPRHSDHHVTPQRPYPALQLDPGQMPVLPHSLPVMAVIALVPPLWRRIMDPRAARWRGQVPSGEAPRDLAS
ncbi:alkane 1-monooxygenase 2 [Roseovarius sp. A-2]|uniref:alkane 1-monooxygenase n=1 Tax=Roseovarius sp. A-2 TaxID=1570360 RepID=UPI0009B52FAB|nr:alkane 1-monooxygenase [Roseovarius sp. A-2]GAW36227.1 alkane 1-monooxygenase 2 [Roseovarius sp. A-2]